MNNKSRFQFLNDNPDIKRMIFFVFYVVFFIFVVILLRSSLKSDNVSSVNRNNSGYQKSFNLNLLKKNNYHFNYKVEKNNEVIIFDGDRLGDKNLFVMSGDNSFYYYLENDLCYLRDNNSLLWNRAINPMEFYKFTLYDNLHKLLVHGSYISKTTYLSGEEDDYNYEISTASVVKNIDGRESDVDGEVNSVSVHVLKDGEISEIVLDLTDYYKYYDNSIYDYKITLSYSKINGIKDSDVKINK